MKSEKENTVFFLFLIILVISLIISFMFYNKINDYKTIFSCNNDKIININNLLITFSSITVGFIATLLGLILTIKDSNLLKKLDKTEQYKSYIYYLRNNICLGLLTVFVSLLLFLLMDINIYIIIIIYRSLIITVFILFSLNLIGVVKSTNIIIDLILNKDKKNSHNKGNNLDPETINNRD